MCNARFAVSGRCFVIFFAGAGTADGAAVPDNFAFEIDTFAALGADDTRAFEAGKILG
jgi:hypothetical protein